MTTISTIPFNTDAIGGGKLKYQEFLSSGTFTPSATLLANGGQVQVFLVGGGGGGGGRAYDRYGGGGGGGGVKTKILTVSGPTSVTIGAGGAAGQCYAAVSGPNSRGANGGTSYFGSFSVEGGGGGGGNVASAVSTDPSYAGLRGACAGGHANFSAGASGGAGMSSAPFVTYLAHAALSTVGAQFQYVGAASSWGDNKGGAGVNGFGAGGHSNQSNTPGAPNTGNGGCDCANTSGFGSGSGGSGYCLVVWTE